METKLEAALFSHAGNVRSNNEDNYLLFDNYRRDISINETKESKILPLQRSVVAVCDGMGGESAGEVASLIAVESLQPCPADVIREQANAQIQAANNRICEEISKRNGTRVGSTVAALYIDGNTAVSCNVGDSRVYLLRDGQIQQLSKDHSEAQRMQDLGVLSADNARNSSVKHRLTQHLGIFQSEFVIEPYFSENIILRNNDLFLLCSDGLTDMLNDSEIKEVMLQHQTIQETAESLINNALKKGGKDNVTVLLLKISEGKQDNKKPERTVKDRKKPKSLVIACTLLALLSAIGFSTAAYTYAQNKKQEAIHKENIDSVISLLAAGEYESAVEMLFKTESRSNDTGNTISDMTRYFEAMDSYAKGDYVDASVKFSSLGTYRNSSAYAQKCDEIIKEQQKETYYEKALDWIRKKEYGKAIKVFKETEIDDFEDAQDWLSYCENEQKDLYDNAKNLYETGNDQEAYDLFVKLDDYLDSKALAQECKDRIDRKNFNFFYSFGQEFDNQNGNGMSETNNSANTNPDSDNNMTNESQNMEYNLPEIG